MRDLRDFKRIFPYLEEAEDYAEANNIHPDRVRVIDGGDAYGILPATKSNK